MDSVDFMALKAVDLLGVLRKRAAVVVVFVLRVLFTIVLYLHLIQTATIDVILHLKYALCIKKLFTAIHCKR